MNNFEFEHPSFFLLLLLLICIYKCPVVIKQFYFPHTYFFTRITNFFNKEKLLYALIFTLFVTALSSPLHYDAKQSQHRKGRDLVFVLDSSGSMGESGYSQEDTTKNKYAILKNLLAAFISKRYDDNVGIVPFGSFAFASVPLTYDMKAIRFLLSFLEVGIAGENTAIGDGIFSAISLFKDSQAKSKVIILITDGYQNSATHSIKESVEAAKTLGIKIYTIGIGEKGDFDVALLQKIAKQTKGSMFSAKDAATLSDVYKELNILEPSPIHSQNYLNKTMLFIYPLGIALLLLLSLLLRAKTK